MSSSSDSSLPSDVCLLLRADAEQSWLHREVIPVLRDLEASGCRRCESPDAALAYLQAMWSQAQVRAGHTDAAHASLCAQTGCESPLSGVAGRYHAAVCTLREIIAARISPLVSSSADIPDGYLDGAAELLGEGCGAGGCAPQAA